MAGAGAVSQASGDGRISRAGCSPKFARFASASSGGTAAWRTRSRQSLSHSGSIVSARRRRSRTWLSECAASFWQIRTSCRCLLSPISSLRTAPPAARRCSASLAATIAFLPRSQERWDRESDCRRSFAASLQTRDGVTAALESNGRVSEARFDYLVCAMPATTVRDVVFEPALPEPQQQAVTVVKYGAATKTALQFDRAPWRTRGKPRGFGTPFPIGAVWDGNEEQKQRGLPRRSREAAKAGILTLLAGGGASAATREMLATEGPSRIVRELSVAQLEEHRARGMDVAELGTRGLVARRLCVLRYAVSAVAAILARAALRPHLLRGRTHEPAMAGVHERGGGDGAARGGGSHYVSPQRRGDAKIFVTDILSAFASLR